MERQDPDWLYEPEAYDDYDDYLECSRPEDEDEDIDYLDYTERYSWGDDDA